MKLRRALERWGTGLPNALQSRYPQNAPLNRPQRQLTPLGSGSRHAWPKYYYLQWMAPLRAGAEVGVGCSRLAQLSLLTLHLQPGRGTYLTWSFEARGAHVVTCQATWARLPHAQQSRSVALEQCRQPPLLASGNPRPPGPHLCRWSSCCRRLAPTTLAQEIHQLGNLGLFPGPT